MGIRGRPRDTNIQTKGRPRDTNIQKGREKVSFRLPKEIMGKKYHGFQIYVNPFTVRKQPSYTPVVFTRVVAWLQMSI